MREMELTILTDEDIEEHVDILYDLRTNTQDCEDKNFYTKMFERFIHTFK